MLVELLNRWLVFGSSVLELKFAPYSIVFFQLLPVLFIFQNFFTIFQHSKHFLWQ